MTNPHLTEHATNLAVRSYCDAMLWANTATMGADGRLDFHAIDLSTPIPDTLRDKARAAVLDFLNGINEEPDDGAGEDLLADLRAYLDLRDADDLGHDFALSRNGHGAGFFDRDSGYRHLQRWAKTFGSNTWQFDAATGELSELEG